jgi:hypothetical protein
MACPIGRRHQNRNAPDLPGPGDPSEQVPKFFDDPFMHPRHTIDHARRHIVD